MNRVLSFLVVFFMALTVNAQMAEADKVINSCATKIKSFQNVDINFTFNLTNEKSRINQTKTGNAIMAGNKFRLVMGNQTIVSDGKTVWGVATDAKEIQISNAEDSDISSPLNIITNWNKLYKTKGMTQKTMGNVKCNVVELASIDAKKNERVFITINSSTNLPVSIVISDKNGSKYTYTVSAFKTNVATDAKTFSVNTKDYNGFEIVDLR